MTTHDVQCLFETLDPGDSNVAWIYPRSSFPRRSSRRRTWGYPHTVWQILEIQCRCPLISPTPISIEPSLLPRASFPGVTVLSYRYRLNFVATMATFVQDPHVGLVSDERVEMATALCRLYIAIEHQRSSCPNVPILTALGPLVWILGRTLIPLRLLS